MKLIVGLGNPGKKYQNNRHNLGFLVIDALKKEIKGPGVILAKPSTFMNSSGEAIKELTTRYRLPATGLLIIHDEIDLPFGTMRFSQGSGSAGHRGVESIIAAIGRDFTRLRIGIDNRKTKEEIPTEEYVLQDFTKEEEEKLQSTIIPKAIEAILAKIK